MSNDEKTISDSGMYLSNSRNYSMFRASENYWNSLIIEEFE